MEPIKVFDGEFAFLSNFYDCPVVIDGIQYQNSEAAFQAMKCEDKSERYRFTNVPAGKAKRFGRRVPLRPDWNDIRLDIMKQVVLDKFTRNKNLGTKLVATGDAELIEGNYWHDTFWGVDDKTGIGENHLGKILMEVRNLLRTPTA